MADHIKGLSKINVEHISLNPAIKRLNRIPTRQNELGEGGKIRPKTMLGSMKEIQGRKIIKRRIFNNYLHNLTDGRSETDWDDNSQPHQQAVF